MSYPSTPAQPLPQPPPPPSSSPQSGLHRPFRATLHRYRYWMLTVFCILSSAVFLMAPNLGRTYDLAGTVDLHPVSFEPLPDLSRLPATLIEHAQLPGVQATLTGDSPASQKLHLSAQASSRDAALVRIQSAADQLTTLLRHQAEELAGNYRTGLQKQQNHLSDRLQSLSRDVDAFRASHRGILPDDPTSIVAQFEKLSSHLDDSQQRLRLVTEQIQRLEDYKRKVQAGVQVIAPPPLPAPAASTPAAQPQSKPEADPEILTLNAQLQLIEDQLNEQLNTMHRTEQHPYVVDLRNQQAALQKKLDAAKQRVAAGQPPPPDVHPPVAVATVPRGPDPSLAAAQQVDLQLESLNAERTTLDVEVHTLTGQKDAMQKQVDEVAPARHEYEALAADLDATRKAHQAVAGQLDAFDHRFRTADVATGTNPFIDIAPLAITTRSTLPSFPRPLPVYITGLLVGLAAALLLASVIHHTDHSFRNPREVASAIDLPILGAVSEIRTPLERQLLRGWKSFARPAICAAFALSLLVSALLCFHYLADPQFDPNPFRAVHLISCAGPSAGDRP